MEPTQPTLNPEPQPQQPQPQLPPNDGVQQTPPQPVPSQPDGSDINQMVVLQPGERVVCQIKRHPIGLIGQFVSSGIVIAVALVLALILGPELTKQNGDSSAAALVYAGVGLLVLIVLVFLAVANSIYWKNRWIVTSDSLTQILQPSLFGRQASQLSLDDLEDVTVRQTGILQSMFNFGTLRAETAGERSKFAFPYCPNPNYYARQILVAREDFMNGKRYTQEPRPRP